MTTGQMIKRFLEPIREKGNLRGVALRAMVYPFLSSCIGIAIIGTMREVVADIQGGEKTRIQIYLIYLVIILFVWLIGKTITRNWGLSEIRPKYYNYFSQKYLTKYTELDNTTIESLGTGRSLHIMTAGIRGRTYILGDVSVKLSEYITKAFFSIGFIFFVNYFYGILFMCLLGILVYLYIYTQKRANIYRKEKKSLEVEYDRDIVKIIMSKFEITQNNKITKEVMKYGSIFQKRYNINKRVEMRRWVSESSSILLLNGLRIVAVASLVYGFVGGGLSIADFMAIIIVISMLNEITRSIGRFYIDMSAEFIHVEKLRNLFDTTPKILGYDQGETFKYKNGSIDLHAIHFKYERQQQDMATEVFEKINLSITGSQKTALVGPSGGGKSTLIKLIAGYLHPQSGTIAIDGQFLPTEQTIAAGTNIRLDSYYSHIGYLTQEPSVFDGTVRENLLYGVTADAPPLSKGGGGDLLDESLDNIISLAKCEFIYDFPHGLDTEIGEKGIRLSGGQRQRLAIAKIMLKNPDIILLDEPTSALDSYNEEQVTIALNNLFKGKTVIIIAHRLQTVKHADDIIYIADGKVIERGTHDELLKLKGEYYKMVELQSGF